jgi:Family of unknown function (DUF5691)
MHGVQQRGASLNETTQHIANSADSMLKLHRALMLGIERSATQLPKANLPSGLVSNPHSNSSAEAAPLALVWLAQLSLVNKAAGQSSVLVSSNTLFSPSPDASTSVSNESSAQFIVFETLKSCLELGEAGVQLVHDLLRRLQQKSIALPSTLLPLTLNFLVRFPRVFLEPFELSDAIGLRGRWLSELNPDWFAIAVPEVLKPALTHSEALALWEVGSEDERLKLLTTQHFQQPEDLRSLIETTRATDATAQTVAYIKAWAPMATMADQAWLESLLDAKHKTLRNAAAECLRSMPKSALSNRALDYLTGVLIQPSVIQVLRSRSLMGLLKSKPVLEIQLPNLETVPEKPLLRDGYEIKIKTNGTELVGAKLSLVLQWLEYAPLSSLCERLAISSAELIQCAGEHESANALLQVLVNNILRETKPDLALVEQLAHLPAINNESTLALLKKLSVETRRAFFLKSVKMFPISQIVESFTEENSQDKALSIKLVESLKREAGAYYAQWQSNRYAGLALFLDQEVARQFVAEARLLRSKNTDDMPSDKKKFFAAFWEPLFNAIDYRLCYEAALNRIS